MIWVPVIKLQLEEKFSEQFLFSACDTAHFVMNGNIAIVCHKLYGEMTNYYPEDWPTTTIEVFLASPDYPSYRCKPADSVLQDILASYPSDIDGYKIATDSSKCNHRIFNYDGSILYQLLTHFINIGATLAPLSNLVNENPLYINDHGYE